MTRKTRRVEAPPVKPQFVTLTDYKCDGCGREISREDYGDGYAHELSVVLDDGECVSLRLRRDLCPQCLNPLWEKINELLGVSADHSWDEQDRDYGREEEFPGEGGERQ